MIHQHFMLVDPMTVTENIVLGNEPRKWFGLAVDREGAETVRELSERYGFDVDPDARSRTSVSASSSASRFSKRSTAARTF